jgi:hypothetical protein
MYVSLFAVLFLLGCEAKPPAAGAQPARAGAPPAPAREQQAAPRAQEPAGRTPQAAAPYTQQARPDVQKTSLCLELQPARRELQLGEPLSLVASLINCSPSRRDVDDLLSPEFGFLQIWIQPPEGKELLYRPIARREGRGKGMRSLEAGERTSVFVPVYASADGWTITRPGRYRLRAQYSVDGGALESKPDYVTVTPPSGEADRYAANLMVSLEVARVLVGGRDDSGDAAKRLTAIVEKYPQSRLAPYAGVGLAIADSRDGFDPYTKTFRKGGCERAVDALARAPEIADPSLASAGTAAWIRCLRQLGRDKEVNGAISRFLRAHPAAKDVASLDQAFGIRRQEAR